MNHIDKSSAEHSEQMHTINESSSVRQGDVGKLPSEDRLVMLSDGIFAISITLLVINIKLPGGLNNVQFNAALSTLFSSDILFYLITFFVVASYWRLHRRMLHIVKQLDMHFITLNFLFLAFVAFFPVSSNIIESYSYRNSVILYTLSIAGCGFSALAIWLYASWQHRLIDQAMTRKEIIYFGISLAQTSVYICLSLLLLFSPIKPVDIFWTWLLLIPLNFLVERVSHERVTRRLANGLVNRAPTP